MDYTKIWVTVYNRASGEVIDENTFSAGSFSKIGEWLDYRFYNDQRNEVKIRFL